MTWDGTMLDAWHTVGAAGEPTFQSSWVNFDARTAQFIRVGRIVRLRGIIKSGTVGSVAFNLPAGFRPATRVTADHFFPCVSNNAFGAVTVNGSDGAVVPGAGSNVWFDLSSVSFLAEG